jgi:hypothetical protein
MQRQIRAKGSEAKKKMATKVRKIIAPEYGCTLSMVAAPK